MRKLLLISISLLIAGGVYAPLIPMLPDAFLECNYKKEKDRPIWFAIGKYSVWITEHTKPKMVREVSGVEFDEYKIVMEGGFMTINRMDSSLTFYHGKREALEIWACIQYSEEEYTNRKQKFYDSIVKERKF